MKVYFVRHGETALNATGIHQPGTAELSEKGIKQAEALAKRFTSISIDVLISSPFERAKKTAEIINKVLDKKIIYLDSLKEIKRPSEIEGKPQRDPEVERIKKLVFDNFGNAGFHYADEENFFDLKERGIKAFKYISNLEAENILVVSHGTIIRMVVALMMFGKDLNVEEFLSVQEFFGMNNTGISICETGGYRGWKLETWNDSAHLGE